MEKCGTCKYFLPNSNGYQGECRRHAPVIVNCISEKYQQVYPSTYMEEWCGDYELDLGLGGINEN